MTRSALLLPLVIFAVLGVPWAAAAHDGWIESHPWLAEPGQPVSFLLLYGNHSNNHRSYRLAAKWESPYTRLSVVDPTGREHDLTAQIVDLGEDVEAVGPKGVKGFHVATFTPPAPGLYLALAKQIRILEFGGPKFQSILVAKSAFIALLSPTVLAAQGAQGFDRAIGGPDVLEIVPLTNPVGVRTGDTVTFEVRFRGQPAAGQVVSLVRRLDGAASAQDRTSDGQGRVTLSTGPADYYLARVGVEDQARRVEGQFEKSAYEATYVFPVFHRR